MSLLADFSKRSEEVEIMDDLDMEGELLEKTLDQLSWINIWLGGNHVTWKGIQKIYPRLQDDPIHLCDLGTGGGDALVYLANKTKRLKPKFQFIGLDANEATLAYATKQSIQHSNIRYQKINLLDDQSSFKGIDIVTCALFLHHFKEEELIRLLTKCKDEGVKFIVINDLQRHKLPYLLFWGLSKILRFSKMAQHDGLLSIRKAFTKQDLNELMQKSEISNYKIYWKWAFRYLLIADLRESP